MIDAVSGSTTLWGYLSRVLFSRVLTGRGIFRACCPACPSTSCWRRRWWCTALPTLRRWTTFSPNTASGQLTGMMKCVEISNSWHQRMCPSRTMQNYLMWQLIVDRVNSLSRRFKDARARYRKVRLSWPGDYFGHSVTSLRTCVIRLFMGPRQRTLGGGNVSVMSRAAWRMQLELCTCVKPLLERANKW